jgi:hypothetical protein
MRCRLYLKNTLNKLLPNVLAEPALYQWIFAEAEIASV